MPPNGAQANPLATGGAPPPSGDPSSHPLIDSLEAAHQQTKAQFGKLDKAQKSAQLVRGQLDSLVKMGDAVTADDVIEGLGKMVAGGLSPEPLIAMMAGDPSKGQAPMPESGEALVGWLQGHEQQFAQIEAQIAQSHAQAQHQLGQDATKVLLAHHVADQVRAQGQSAPPTAPSTPPNPLAG